MFLLLFLKNNRGKIYKTKRFYFTMHYTLQDRGYFNALKIITDEFSRQGMPYALVGGAGTQARIANLLCRVQKTDIPNAVGLEHLLRETKDFDITSNVPEETWIGYFNELQALHPNISVTTERIRSKQLQIHGKEEATVFINYQTGPQDFSGLDESFYKECIETAEPLRLRYSGTNLSVQVATPECLITSKLTRSDPKDVWDIAALVKTMKKYRQYSGKLKQDKIQEYLRRANREEIIGRYDEIKKQIIKE